ncbi:Sushi, von Willebrand factor type A, EGF and pentraxin domain-containing protein 1, partial [Geodia barretti]
AVIDCGILPPIPNGGVTTTGTEIDAQATYSCNGGFVLQGVEIRICQGNGLWSVEAPSCIPRQVFTCVELEAPENGEVSVSGLTVGSVASYRCNNGFILVGTTSRRCHEGARGGWTGNAPTCQRVDCGLLEPPQNGQVMVMGTTLGSR